MADWPEGLDAVAPVLLTTDEQPPQAEIPQLTGD
jgi:hypothetical protein